MIDFDEKLLLFRDTLALLSPIALLLTQKAAWFDEKNSLFF
jgi:hypothetical protein